MLPIAVVRHNSGVTHVASAYCTRHART